MRKFLSPTRPAPTICLGPLLFFKVLFSHLYNYCHFSCQIPGFIKQAGQSNVVCLISLLSRVTCSGPGGAALLSPNCVSQLSSCPGSVQAAALTVPHYSPLAPLIYKAVIVTANRWLLGLYPLICLLQFLAFVRLNQRQWSDILGQGRATTCTSSIRWINILQSNIKYQTLEDLPCCYGQWA